MKRLFLATVAASLLLGALALSGHQQPSGDLQVDSEKRNPWTSLKLNNGPDTFHFAVVSDRTGGHRARIFSQAVEQLNLLQPAFVISVGDLIEGYTKEQSKLAEQWKEFQGYVHKLQMPFFYVPGNHDVANQVQAKEWESRFGRRYFHFGYRDVLFLMMNSDDPYEEGEARISKEQVEWVERALKDNPTVRWTIVALHKPIWTQKDLEKAGWLAVEKALAGRNYTVFAGHIHRYQKFVRQGMNYYQLATTGGSSKMRGLAYGEFDHIVWVTMKKDGPVLANIMLEGIYPENLQKPITAEDGFIRHGRLPTHPVTGKVFLDGAPVVGGKVEFHLVDADGKKFTRVSDALVEADGGFTLSRYEANDGAPIGEYAVTVVQREPFFDAAGNPGPNKLPAKYATPKTTDLRFKVVSGSNDFTINLSR